MYITVRPVTNRFHALAHIEKYIVPGLQFTKSQPIIQLLPSSKVL